MQSNIEVSRENMDEFCRRWRIEKLSVDHNHKERSPVDHPVLRVKFNPSAEWSFADRVRMEREFQLLSGSEIRLRRRKLMAARGNGHTRRVLYNA